MNEYYINVNFDTGRINSDLKKLVQNDYNTTKINFTFDKEGRVLFKMLYPDGTQYVDEIQNNELIFGPGILNQEGDYEYEISLYTEDGRLTDYATKVFVVRSELVDTDELVQPDDRVPVLDALIEEVSAIKVSAENGDFNGEDGVTPTIGANGNWFIGNVDTGMPSQGPQGETGGVSLEEVKAITGELDTLSTEDKSNLVNAINEVLTSGSMKELNNAVIDIWYDINITPGVYLISGKETTIKYVSGSYKPLSNDTGKYVMVVSRVNDDDNNSGCGCVIFQQGMNYMNIRYLCWNTNITINLQNILTTSQAQTVSGIKTFTALPVSSVTPTTDTQLTNKAYVDSYLSTITGYDATTTQVLKNVNGVLTWVTE